MKDKKTIMSKEFGDVERVTIGCLDVEFNGPFVWVNCGDREVSEIWTERAEDVPYGFEFSVPDLWDGYLYSTERRVPLNVSTSSVLKGVFTYDIHDYLSGIVVYADDHPLIAIQRRDDKTYFYAARIPAELYGSSIEFAPLTLCCGFDAHGHMLPAEKRG